MKQRFWLFKRGSVFYLQDSKTGKKDSLGTRDPKQAERLRAAKNEAAEKPLLGLWPVIQFKRKRGVPAEEHRRIIAAEGNIERRHFYELLWEVARRKPMR